MKKRSSLKRDLNPVPQFVKETLQENDLNEEFENRPAYQQNDYIGWIKRTKRETTKHKRLNQMLDELRKGGVYMNMTHPSSA